MSALACLAVLCFVTACTASTAPPPPPVATEIAILNAAVLSLNSTLYAALNTITYITKSVINAEATACFSSIPPVPSTLNGEPFIGTLALNNLPVHVLITPVGSAVKVAYNWQFGVGRSDCTGCITFLSVGATTYGNACVQSSYPVANQTIVYSFAPKLTGCVPLFANIEKEYSCVPETNARARGESGTYIGALYVAPAGLPASTYVLQSPIFT